MKNFLWHLWRQFVSTKDFLRPLWRLQKLSRGGGHTPSQRRPAHPPPPPSSHSSSQVCNLCLKHYPEAPPVPDDSLSAQIEYLGYYIYSSPGQKRTPGKDDERPSRGPRLGRGSRNGRPPKWPEPLEPKS